MLNNKPYVEARSKTMYHLVMFVSFLAAVSSLPYVMEWLSSYVNNLWLNQLLSIAIVYLAAAYVIPIMGFFIARRSLKSDNIY